MDRIPTLVQLLRFVAFRIADRWHDIGVQLQFKVDDLNLVDKNHQPVDVEICCKSMLYLWKKSTTDNTAKSVKQLISAIKEAGRVNFASELQKEDPQRLLDTAFLESEVVPRIATDWFDIGLYLDISDHHLDNIKHLTDPCGSKCIDMLGRWLKREPDHPDKSFRPTWRNMYNAMRAIDYVGPAEELKEDVMS